MMNNDIIYLIPIVDKNGNSTNQFQEVCKFNFEYLHISAYTESLDTKEKDNVKKEN